MTPRSGRRQATPLQFHEQPFPSIRAGSILCGWTGTEWTQLLDVVPLPERDDRCLVGRAAATEKLAELAKVLLVTGGRDTEQHAHRCRTRVGERVRAAGRHVHEATGAAAGDGGAGR